MRIMDGSSDVFSSDLPGQRDPAQGVGIFCAGGARPPRQMVMSFIDSHREELGIEPICRELAIAPSSYHEHAARLADPAKRSARARRDDEIKQQIKRVHDDRDRKSTRLHSSHY